MRACSASSSMRTSPTPRSSSAAVTSPYLSMRGRCLPSQALRRCRERDDVVPDVTSGHVVALEPRGTFASTKRSCTFLLRPASRSPGRRVRTRARPRAFEQPGPERDTPLEPQLVVLAHSPDPGPRGRRTSCPRSTRSARPAIVRAPSAGAGDASASAMRFSSAPGWSCRSRRKDLVPDESALRVDVRGVAPHLERVLATVRLCLVAPHAEQRPDDAVLTLQLDALRRSRGDEPEEDRLDLVGGRMPRRTQAMSLGKAVTELAELRLVTCGRRLDHIGSQQFAAVARVPLRLLAAEAVIHVHCRDAISELPRHVPEACRIGATRHEAPDLSAGDDQIVSADRLFDPISNGARHAPIVPACARTGWPTRRRPATWAAARSRHPRRSPRARMRSTQCSAPSFRARVAEISSESFRTRPSESIHTSTGTVARRTARPSARRARRAPHASPSRRLRVLARIDRGAVVRRLDAMELFASERLDLR